MTPFAAGIPAERVAARASGLGITINADFLARFAVLEMTAREILNQRAKAGAECST